MPKIEIHVAHLWQNLKCICSGDGGTTVQLRSYVYKRHMNFYHVLILCNKNQNYIPLLKLPHNQHEDATFQVTLAYMRPEIQILQVSRQETQTWVLTSFLKVCEALNWYLIPSEINNF